MRKKKNYSKTKLLIDFFNYIQSNYDICQLTQYGETVNDFYRLLNHKFNKALVVEYLKENVFIDLYHKTKDQNSEAIFIRFKKFLMLLLQENLVEVSKRINEFIKSLGK